MNALMIVLVLFGTVMLAFVTGISLSYFAASGILRAFGHRPQKQRPVLAPVTVRSSGD